MNEQQIKTDKECIDLLLYLFSDAQELYKQLAPNGWENCDFKTIKKISRFVNKLPDSSNTDNANICFSNFQFVLALAIYDVFSLNNEVTDRYGKLYDLGSFRGSARLIAGFLNTHYPNPHYSFNYTDFYLGSYTYHDTDYQILLPVYIYIFKILFKNDLEWEFCYPSPLNMKMQEEINLTDEYVNTPIVAAYNHVYGKMPKTTNH